MGIKKRVKGALFAFFKDELIESASSKIGLNNVSFEHVKPAFSNRLDFKELRAEIEIIDPRKHGYMGFEADRDYEMQVRSAKEKLFDSVMDHVIIDDRALLDPRYFGNRVVRMSIFIGDKTKQYNH